MKIPKILRISQLSNLPKPSLPKPSRQILLILTGGAIFVSLSLYLVNSPSQAIYPQMFGRIGSNYCLNAHNPAPESNVNLWQCNENDPDQKWQMIPLEPVNNTKWMIQRVGSNYCLNAHNPAPESNVNLWQCNENDPDQIWETIGFGEINKQMIRRVGSDYCLNAHNPAPESNVNLWKCDENDPDQHWKNIPLSSHTGNINLPYGSSQTWYVCQGYNGTVSHQNNYAFDLSTAQDFGGNNACWAADNNVNKSAGREVLAPTTGTVWYVGQDLVCLEIDSTRSLLIGHIDRRVSNGQRVGQDTVLGTVSQANSVNGGYAHIHIEARQSPRCTRGTSVPFTATNGFQLNGIGDLPGPVTNTHWKRELRRP